MAQGTGGFPFDTFPDGRLGALENGIGRLYGPAEGRRDSRHVELLRVAELDDPSHADLRSNLRVDVFIVTDTRENALKVRKGPFAGGAGRQVAFVVRQGQAYRTEIEIGLSSFDDLEIVSGVVAGDEIVISDMTDYKHMKQIPIR